MLRLRHCSIITPAVSGRCLRDSSAHAMEVSFAAGRCFSSAALRNLVFSAPGFCAGADLACAHSTPGRGVGEPASFRSPAFTASPVVARDRARRSPDGLRLLVVACRIASHPLVLWRFHNVHHSDLDMDVSTATRFHLGEVVFSVPFRVVTVALSGSISGRSFSLEFLFENREDVGTFKLVMPSAWSDSSTTPRHATDARHPSLHRSARNQLELGNGVLLVGLSSSDFAPRCSASRDHDRCCLLP